MNNTKNKIKYRALNFRNNTKYTRQEIFELFGVDCPFSFLDGETEIGYSMSKHQEIVEALLNGGWKLITVSEDNSHMMYHFIYEEKANENEI